jgi:hypothetical protein
MLYPFSVNEISQDMDDIEIKRHLDDFLRYGLYPDVYNSKYTKSEEILKELTGSYLFKDIFKFKGIRNPEFLLKLLQILALEIGNEIAFTELAGATSMDKKTVGRYIDLMEKAFIIFRMPPLSRELTQELGKTRKIYFYDLGLRNSLLNNFNQLELRNDVEQLWENFVVLERMKYLKNAQKSYNRFFWRTYDHKTIDYIEERDGQLFAYDLFWDEKNMGKEYKMFEEAYRVGGFQRVGPETGWEAVKGE